MLKSMNLVLGLGVLALSGAADADTTAQPVTACRKLADLDSAEQQMRALKRDGDCFRIPPGVHFDVEHWTSDVACIIVPGFDGCLWAKLPGSS